MDLVADAGLARTRSATGKQSFTCLCHARTIPPAARPCGRTDDAATATGPDHKREFTAAVFVSDTNYGSGTGRTKKEAEQRAAEQACQALNQLDGALPGETAG